MLRILLLSMFFISISFSYTKLNSDFVYDNFKIQYLNDKTSKLTINDISKINFTNEIKNNFNLGYKKGTIWFKFDFENNKDYEEFILSLNESFYEIANLYYYDKKWIRNPNSLFTLIKDREIKSNHLAFDINIPTGEKRTFYLELKAKYAYFGKVVFYEENYFHFKNSIGTNVFFIFILGIVLSLILFTLFLYIKTREKIYFYYLFYCFFNFIYFTNISGILVYFDLQEYIYKLQLAPAFMIGFLALFSREFLDTKRYLARFDKVLVFLSIPFFILGLLVVYSYQPWNKFINNYSGLMGILLVVISIIVYLKGNHRTKYYIYTMILYLSSIFMFTFMVNGTLEYTNVTRYGVMLINALEMLIFTYILANRYLLMKEDTQSYLESEVSNRTSELTILLKERELLLKELYHRVKNNFHMLIGMLHLEDTKKSEEKDFRALINRVKSMSMIHEYLYKSKNLSNIDIKSYFSEIIFNIKNTYSNVKIDSQIEDVSIDFDNALSIGIIINEVLANAVKHNDIADFRIDIKLYKIDKTVYLCIHDNGKGFELKDTKGLGLKLIKQFSKKLPNVHYSFSFEKGTKFELEFNRL